MDSVLYAQHAVTGSVPERSRTPTCFAVESSDDEHQVSFPGSPGWGERGRGVYYYPNIHPDGRLKLASS